MKNTRTLRIWGGFWLLLLLLFVFILWNIFAGSVSLSASEIWRILLGGDVGFTQSQIIVKIRLPRLLSALILGGALSLSGFLLQSFFHNLIAGPFVLGISSGAKMTVCVAKLALLSRGKTTSSAILIAAAFVGAMVSMGFVLLLSQRVKRMSLLVVCGVMIGYICSALTDFLVTFADDSNIVNLHNWSLGSFSGSSWDDIAVIAVVVITVSTCVFAISKPLSAFQLGEAYAKSVGVNVARFRVVLVLLASMLSACVTAFAGPVSFVGIAVPHLVKSALKSSKPIRVIPACFLGGAIFCAGCDLIARTLFSPVELSISAVTASFGAPVVIALMLKNRVR